MKTLIMGVIVAGLCIQGRAASLSTTDGRTYENITMQRADPDGLYIEYTLPGGGLGMSKVKFTRLTADQQKQYGYDATKAKEFEAGVAKANQEYRDESMKLEKAAQEHRATLAAEEQNETKTEAEYMMAQAQLKMAEAQLARAKSGAEESAGMDNYGGGYGWAGGAVIAGPGVGGINNVNPTHLREGDHNAVSQHRERTIGEVYRQQVFRAATRTAP
jgi:hypothetical protein